MKYAKMLGLLAIVAAAVMAFAGSASATELTNSASGTKVAKGDTIHAENESNTVLDGTVNITCKKSTVDGTVSNAGGASATVEGSISSLTFTECGANTVTVSTGGELILHAIGSGNGTLTSSKAKVTVLTHNILGTVHCIYTTGATHIGTLTGSNNLGGNTATLHIDSAAIPQESTDFGCGNDAEWTGDYLVDSPMYLSVD